jgi:hypothetical protein
MNQYLERLEVLLTEIKIGLGETQHVLLYEKAKDARLLLESFKRATRSADALCRKPVQGTDCYLKRGHTGDCLPFPKPPESIKEHEDSPRGMQQNCCPKINEKKHRCNLPKHHAGECEFQ